MKFFKLFLTIFVGFIIWMIPNPQGVSDQAWQLLAIFVATIFGVVSSPLPMGAMALLGLSAVVLTNTLPFAVAFSGFSNHVVWLIVLVFFIARGFIKTGLGMRISYVFLSLLGKKTLGLGYGMALTDFLLAPAIPSSTARTGGVVLPILESLAKMFHSEPHSRTSRKIGSYLSQVTIHSACVSSAMFLTAMAANPLIAEIVRGFGVNITWMTWFLAALVPGLVNLALVPYLIFILYPPEVTESPDAPVFAREELKKMGKIKQNEWIMLGTFVLMVGLWIFGDNFGLLPVTTTLLGLIILLLTNVLNWNDIRKEEGAWETLIWFAVLVMMASQLNALGLTEWISQLLATQVQGWAWAPGLAVLSIVYYYSHYFFASQLAHATTMYSTFFVVALSLGAPPALTALLLGFLSSLCGGLTHYASGPSALIFGLGFVRIGTWWKLGIIMSGVQLIVWFVIGGLWWKVLGIW